MVTGNSAICVIEQLPSTGAGAANNPTKANRIPGELTRKADRIFIREFLFMQTTAGGDPAVQPPALGFTP
jgi:hypothetical protein